MLKIYGNDQCRYCVACREELEKVGICYEYKDILKELTTLKEFMKLRDTEPAFDKIKGNGIGIPCIVKENGSITFDWREFLLEK